MTPEEAAAGKAAKTAAFRQMTASLRYAVNRYWHLSAAAEQATRAMNQVTAAWSAANGSPDPASGAGGGTPHVSYGTGGVQPPQPGVAWGSAGGGAGGYASGGLVQGQLSSQLGLPPAPSPGAGRRIVRRGGTDGFDGDTPVVAGSVTGYRWWTIPAPDLGLNPLDADEDWPRAPLHGAWAPWAPGVNHAVCLASPSGPPAHDPALVPEISCGCGYWGYWGVQRHELGHARSLPVFGVIKGFGKTLTGPHGFRCAKARILAVHLPLIIGNAEHLQAERQRLLAGTEHNNPKFTGRVISIGTDYVPWQLQARDMPDPPSEAEIAAEKVKGEAWMAVIGDRIRQMCPGTEVCETREHLLAKYPPDKVYGSR